MHLQMESMQCRMLLSDYIVDLAATQLSFVFMLTPNIG